MTRPEVVQWIKAWWISGDFLPKIQVVLIDYAGLSPHSYPQTWHTGESLIPTFPSQGLTDFHTFNQSQRTIFRDVVAILLAHVIDPASLDDKGVMLPAAQLLQGRELFELRLRLRNAKGHKCLDDCCLCACFLHLSRRPGRYPATPGETDHYRSNPATDTIEEG
jgi:hypothetical protein